jgi:hypothetical protein
MIGHSLKIITSRSIVESRNVYDGFAWGHGHMARSGHGLPKVSLGPAMLYPCTPWRRPALNWIYIFHGGSLLLPWSWTPHTSKFHDQGDAGRIVIRGQLRGHNDTPFGRPPLGGIWWFKLLLISNIVFRREHSASVTLLSLGPSVGWSVRWSVRQLVGPHIASPQECSRLV